MRLGGIFLTALLVLAAAQAAAAALCLLLLVAIMVGACLYPRETFGLIGLCVVAGLVQAQPFASLVIIGLTIVGSIRRR